MLKVLGVDPGANQGWALYEDSALVSCGLGDVPASLLAGLTGCLIEKPTSYAGSPVPPGDLITLGTRAGRTAGLVEGLTGVVAEYVEPRTWKGSVTKAQHHPRVWGALGTGRETVVLGLALKQHAAATLKRYKSFEDYLSKAPERASGRDIIDAVAIGLYAVGRRVR